MPEKSPLKEIIIRNDFQYGDLGIVLSMHGKLYHQEYQFNHEYEAHVAEGIIEFAKTYREGRSRLWIAESKGVPIGSVAVMERTPRQAQFRWFLIHPDYRGIGLGRVLVEKTINFAREAGYDSLYLWTYEHLTAAIILYNRFGFQLVEEKKHSLWDQDLTEQRYLLNLKDK
jgi:GNAT superfamily N-acetyltransferase